MSSVHAYNHRESEWGCRADVKQKPEMRKQGPTEERGGEESDSKMYKSVSDLAGNDSENARNGGGGRVCKSHVETKSTQRLKRAANWNGKTEAPTALTFCRVELRLGVTGNRRVGAVEGAESGSLEGDTELMRGREKTVQVWTRHKWDRMLRCDKYAKEEVGSWVSVQYDEIFVQRHEGEKPDLSGINSGPKRQPKWPPTPQ